MSSLQIVIVGIGMIGGSLGLALKEAWGEEVRVTGVDNDQAALATALSTGAIDAALSLLDEKIAAADVVFLCTPVLQMTGLVKKMAPFLKAGTILTDVGSTKKRLNEQIVAMLPAYIEYIGGHPMAGREKSGITAADKNLFRNKGYILIREQNTSIRALERVRQLIQKTGAIIYLMNADEHDHCAAVISHVPHVAAAALVNLLHCYPEPDTISKLAGGGFQDTTRIASSNADMWADICLTNGAAIIDGLEKMQLIVNQVIEDIRQQKRPALHNYFCLAKQRRDELLKKAQL
ncbi:prephenate dehydrogenase [Lucifera butyrica]|uniref:Prephenate dehydrogenase n=1 Tax=Lucifera butyrica TaxID=1351585 RepID=A0A498RF46_9FIRM|nr:prephenate dehydrogenase/arogenate dehydrogenase family protein [Lucifera butyrica]VBB08722.1 prephenate dehydrogenase [Lucifera butyrica]